MTYLLDVNVLIAILDPDHVFHRVALGWFDEVGHRAWATSPAVQNGVVRIVGSAKYQSLPFGCAEVADLLANWVKAVEHQFWPDDISLLDSRIIDTIRLSSSDRITDTYLLALAVNKGGMLATLDRRLSPDAVHGGREALHVIR